MKKLLAALLVVAGLSSSTVKADTTTTRFGLTKPDVGSTNWGPKINTNYDTIDNAAGINLNNTFIGANVFNGATTFNATTVFSSVAEFSDGSIISPAITLASALSTGFYKKSISSLGYSANGSNTVSLTSTGLKIENGFTIQNATSAASAPSYSFGSDTTTGIYGDGSGSVRISISGTQLLKFYSSGLQFINTATQMQANDGTQALPGYGYAADNTTGIRRNGTGLQEIMSNGVTVATFTSSGNKFLGTNTNSSVATGWVGEYLETLVTSPTNVSTTSTTMGDFTSLTLTAGHWLISATVLLNDNGGSTTTFIDAGIGTASGTSTTGMQPGINNLRLKGTDASGLSISIPSYRVNISGSNTYFFKGAVTYTGGTPQYRCRLSAIRTD